MRFEVHIHHQIRAIFSVTQDTACSTAALADTTVVSNMDSILHRHRRTFLERTELQTMATPASEVVRCRAAGNIAMLCLLRSAISREALTPTELQTPPQSSVVTVDIIQPAPRRECAHVR
ncbi:hypothetical protein CONLIGDRAFT_335303 [Coniochaeta ligniaria NRRL 30616]|uniref:Uncharacterized protein n=1 Tax=Coniochaeta ligniaria NRRL 30616 TaxID=1408157 RepID=A0A1J7JIM6_9PEZI|nr:hypothetical protein CONLIGDRAFT_335303 [Coniochaeta ligniaria NRRL 30616]